MTVLFQSFDATWIFLRRNDLFKKVDDRSLSGDQALLPHCASRSPDDNTGFWRSEFPPQVLEHHTDTEPVILSLKSTVHLKQMNLLREDKRETCSLLSNEKVLRACLRAVRVNPLRM